MAVNKRTNCARRGHDSQSCWVFLVPVKPGLPGHLLRGHLLSSLNYNARRPASYTSTLPFVMHLAQSLIYLFGITLVAASSDKSYFTSPVSGTGVRPIFTLGDQLLVSWVTDLGEFNITFWQQSLIQDSAASQGNIYCTSKSNTNIETPSASKRLTLCSQNPCQ